MPKGVLLIRSAKISLYFNASDCNTRKSELVFIFYILMEKANDRRAIFKMYCVCCSNLYRCEFCCEFIIFLTVKKKQKKTSWLCFV